MIVQSQSATCGVTVMPRSACTNWVCVPCADTTEIGIDTPWLMVQLCPIFFANTIAENVRANVAALTARSRILAEAANAGTIMVCGAVYDIHSGTVDLLT